MPEIPISDRILSYIIDNDLKPGDRILSEHELAECLGVGRLQVREGLQALKYLGILRSSTKGGTRVCEMDFSMLARGLRFQLSVSDLTREQLTAARLAMELGALESIARRGLTPPEVESLYAAADCRRRDQSNEEFLRNYRLDCEFHRRLLAAGENPIFEAFSALLNAFFEPGEPDGATGSTASAAAAEEHRQLVHALETGRLELAKSILRYHLSKIERSRKLC